MAIKKHFTELMAHKICKGEEILIICTGPSYSKYFNNLVEFINTRPNMIVMVNNNFKPNDFIIPDYHVFTNNLRFVNFASVVNEKYTRILLGKYIKSQNIQKSGIKSYYSIQYTDRDRRELPGYKNGVIYGFYRGVGQLSIMLAHLMGAEKIWIVGMDGYNTNYGNMHYYHDDKNDMYSKKEMDWRKEHNDLVSQCLKRLRIFGIDFSILTPTIHKEHHLKGVL